MSNTAETQPAGAPEPIRRGVFGRAVDVIDERLGIRAIEYPVPAHANTLGYSLGGLAAVALVILIVTGIALAQFYHPGPGGRQRVGSPHRHQRIFGPLGARCALLGR